MFNFNSPIADNIPNNGMYNIQPSPIGNMLPIGQQGYNTGGYYNNMYNNYYNPYLALRQKEIQEAQLKEQLRKQSDVMKLISKSVNKACGNDISEEQLNEMYEYKYPETYQPDSMEIMQQNVINIHFNGLEYHPYDVRYINYFNNLYNNAKDRCPDDISMYEYNEKMSEEYVNMIIEQDKERQKDLSKLYNTNDYNKLINMNSKGNSYFNSIFNGNNNMKEIDIDDMEVTLPGHLSNEYQKRRQQFLDAIINKK